MVMMVGGDDDNDDTHNDDERDDGDDDVDDDDDDDDDGSGGDGGKLQNSPLLNLGERNKSRLVIVQHFKEGPALNKAMISFAIQFLSRTYLIAWWGGRAVFPYDDDMTKQSKENRKNS